MSEIHDECGVAAIYHLAGEKSPLCGDCSATEVSRLLPRMLLDIQNRGQLAAGMTSIEPPTSGRGDMPAKQPPGCFRVLWR